MCSDHFDIQNSLFDILRFKYDGPSYPPKQNRRKHPGFLAGTETGPTEEELVQEKNLWQEFLRLIWVNVSNVMAA